MTTRDLPDYIQETVIRYTGGFIGLEELAARLGSIVPWDMKGNIILLEDFESEATEWELDATGAGSSYARQTRHKFSGDWALKMVTGDVDGAHVDAERYLYHPGNTKIAIAGRFGWDNSLRELQFGVAAISPAATVETLIRYRKQTTELAIETGDDVWTVIDDSLDLGIPLLIFYPILIVFNLETGKGDKLYIGGIEYDLSPYTPLSFEGETISYLIALIYNREVGDIGSTFYVDDIVVARNVP